MELRWLLLLVLATLAAAQKRAAVNSTGPWPVVSARAVGSQRFPEADILAAVGIKAGAPATPDQFKQGADKLAASGAFEEVSYDYGPAGAGVKVEFKVADAAQFLATSFDNFVWFTDPQLTEAIRLRVPLFRGEVPSDGEMLTEVTDALQAALRAQAIPGEVKFHLQQERQGSPIAGGVFVVEGNPVRVRDITFPGASPEDVRRLDLASKPLLQIAFQRSTAESFVQLSLRPVFLQRGYLKVSFERPKVTLVSDDPRNPNISLAVPVAPGPQYRLGAVRWSGNQALPAAELDKLLPVRIGEPADALGLQKGLDAVKEAYASHGYLRQTTRESPTYDDSINVVSYELQVNEGDQYKFAEVEITGLEARLLARVRDLWQLREGEPYDSNYIKKFLRAIAPMLGAGVVTKVQQDVNDAEKTVEVTIHFDFQRPVK